MIEIDQNEQIIMVVRKHWFALVQQGVFYLFMLAVPIGIIFGLAELPVGEAFVLSGPGLSIELFAISIWLLVIWVSLYLTLTDYILDVMVITDRRVFVIDQQGLFRRESSSFRIDRIQDITVEVRGVIATFLDFGRILVETAGEGEVFRGTMIARPYEVKKHLNEAIDKAVAENRHVSIEEANEAAEHIVPPVPPSSPSTPPPIT